MSEFCLKCFRVINGVEVSENEMVMSEELEFCEGCGQMKFIVICAKRNNIFRRFLLAAFKQYRD